MASQSPSAEPSVDPSWTANLYAAGSLDEAVETCLLPLLRRFPNQQIWWLRYARGGVHLKIRCHALTEEEAMASRRLLRDEASGFLDGLPVAKEDLKDRHPWLYPAIDLEDEDGRERSSRELVFTAYRRSSVSFGPEPFLSDAQVVRRMVQAQAAGCRRLADTWRPGLSQGRRRRMHLELVADALGALPLSEELCTDYLAYHRDWLTRGILLGKATEEEELLAKIDHRLMKSGLVGLLAPVFSAPIFSKPLSPGSNSWGDACAGLFVAVESRHATVRLDPFARLASFTALFKVLHGVASALGQTRMEEALVYHLLGRLARPILENVET